MGWWMAWSLVWACGSTPASSPVEPADAPPSTIVRLAATEWPPYTGADLAEQGWLTQVTREAFAHEGLEVQVEFLPWARALRDTEALRFDGVLAAYDTPERRAIYQLSDPMPGGPVELWTRVGSGIAPDAAVPTLFDRPLGVVRGYVNPPQIDDEPHWKRDEANDDLGNLRKLLFSRVDLIVIDAFTGRWLLKTQLPDETDHVVALTPPLDVRTVHVGFPRTHPRHAELAAAFDAGLAALTSEGRLSAILDAWGLDAPSAPVAPAPTEGPAEPTGR